MLRASHVRLYTPSDLISGGFNYDFKYSLDAKNAGDGLGVSSAVTSKGGVGGGAVTQVLQLNSFFSSFFHTSFQLDRVSLLPHPLNPSKVLKCQLKKHHR